MQIHQINSIIPKNTTKLNNNGRNNLSNSNLNRQNNADVSFKGIPTTIQMGVFDKLALWVANAIENGGLFVSFTLQDMLGTNLPRPIMGLKRNAKENKGEANKSFAAKELVREMLTGPSMFIIPAGMLAAGKKAFGKTINIPMKAINALSDIHASGALNAEGQAIGKQEFFEKAFTKIIQNAKSETTASEETISKAVEFAKQLADSAADKSVRKESINKISSEFIEISKNFAKDPAHTDFTQAAFSDTTSASIKDAISYITSYADDIVEKAKQQDPGKLNNYIKQIANKKVIGRFAMNAAMFAAVMTFLQIIPKLYNKAEGKDNAGLKGLMKEETLQDKSLQADNKAKEKNPTDKKDKSKPSFGSSAALSKTLTGSGIIGKMAQGIEFSGCNLSFPLLLGVMGFGILLPRTKQAKDKYDKEEILRRDVVTCTTMCFAEKELRKGFSKINENKSGLVLAAKDKSFQNKNIFSRIFDYLRPIKGVQVLSTEQIISKYSNIGNYKDGIKGFCDFIEGQGGNLKKVFSLTEESKSIVNSLLEQEGKTIENADNSLIKEVINKAKDTDEVKKLIDLFKDKNNPWVTKAKTLNARFTALSVLVLVPAFLGFLLPWINEKTTKKKIAEENASHKVKQNTQHINNAYIENNSNIFKDMECFSK